MKLSYTVLGLLIGLFLGSLLGLGESSYTKKSQRGSTVSVLTIAGALFGASVGAIFGHRLGVKTYIEEKTGIAEAQTMLFKDGRFWSAQTTWADSREKSIKNVIETRRIGQKQIVSFLNSSLLCSHDTESASRESITKCQNVARQFVFDKIIATFEEDAPKDIASLFKTDKGNVS
jgi:hypothetical protein